MRLRISRSSSSTRALRCDVARPRGPGRPDCRGCRAQTRHTEDDAGSEHLSSRTESTARTADLPPQPQPPSGPSKKRRESELLAWRSALPHRRRRFPFRRDTPSQEGSPLWGLAKTTMARGLSLRTGQAKQSALLVNQAGVASWSYFKPSSSANRPDWAAA